MNGKKTANRPPPRRSPRRTASRAHPILVSDVPKFLIKLIGWRRLKPERTVSPPPRYRHD